MRKIFLTCLIILWGTASGRAADDAEKVIVDILKVFDDLNSSLAKISDKPTAEKALNEIKKLSKRAEDIRKKAEKLNVDPRQEEQLFKKYNEDMLKAGLRVREQIKRLDGYEQTKPVLEEVVKLIEKMGIDTSVKKEK